MIFILLLVHKIKIVSFALKMAYWFDSDEESLIYVSFYSLIVFAIF